MELAMSQAAEAFTTSRPRRAKARAPITREQLRARIALAVDKMIAALDALDGDPDLEGQLYFTPDGRSIVCVDQDLERDDCDLEDGGDTEPNGDEDDHSEHSEDEVVPLRLVGHSKAWEAAREFEASQLRTFLRRRRKRLLARSKLREVCHA